MIVWRVLYELIVRGTPSDRVMVTIYKKGGAWLTIRVVERSDALLRHARQLGLAASDPRVHNLRIGTIHSLCDSLLAEFVDDYRADGILLIDENETMVRMANHGCFFELGNSQSIAPGRRLYDQIHQVNELVSLFRPLGIRQTNGRSTNATGRLPLVFIGSTIRASWWPRCSDQPTRTVLKIVHNIAGLTDELERAREGWRSYLDRHKILDFSSIQQVFRERQDILTSCLDHVFIDEFQDTNQFSSKIHTRWLNSANLRLPLLVMTTNRLPIQGVRYCMFQ